ncbi:TPA: hypothetical protein ACGDML_002176, partial [Acinetobacter baumannii]
MKLLFSKDELNSKKLSDLILNLFEQNDHISFLCDET